MVLRRLDQGPQILWEARAAETRASVQEFRPDPVVDPDPARHFLYIRTDALAEIGYFRGRSAAVTPADHTLVPAVPRRLPSPTCRRAWGSPASSAALPLRSRRGDDLEIIMPDRPDHHRGRHGAIPRARLPAPRHRSSGQGRDYPRVRPGYSYVNGPAPAPARPRSHAAPAHRLWCPP